MDPLPRMIGGICLRRLAPADLPAFQAYRRDDELGRYQGWSHTSDDEAASFLAEMNTAALLRAGAWSQIAIARPGDDATLLGDIGLLLAEDGREAEIGFTLSRAFQGRGIAIAAVRAAIGMVFEMTAAERVCAITDARNAASIRLLERIGMRRVASVDAVFRGEACVEHTYVLPKAVSP